MTIHPSFFRNTNFLTLFLALFTVLSGLHAQSWNQWGDDIDGEFEGDACGSSVSLSDDGLRVAIGARNSDGNGIHSGHVRIFEYQTDEWVQLGNNIDGETRDDNSGTEISISGDGSTVAIGASDNVGFDGNFRGHVRVFKLVSGSWSQQGLDIDGERGERIGDAVALNSDGSILAYGTIYNDSMGPGSGAVRVFEFKSGSWSQMGGDIPGESLDDNSGESIDLSADGSIVAIGAKNNDGTGIATGHVRIYKFDTGIWTQMGQDIDGENDRDQSGESVSLSNDGMTVAIGASGNDDGGFIAGHVRIFTYDSGSWNQVGSDIDGIREHDYAGNPVTLSGDGLTVAFRAVFNTVPNASLGRGNVRIYRLESGDWKRFDEDIEGEAEHDNSGWAISLNEDGTTLAIGATNNGGTAEGAGHVRVFKLGALTSVNEKNDILSNILVYPNPNQGNVNIDFGRAQLTSVIIRDINGHIIFQKKNIVDQEFQFEINGPDGTYMIEVMSANQSKAFSVVKSSSR